MRNIQDLTGYIAAALGVIAFIPQILKLRKERSAKAISTLMYTVYAISVLLWLTYGIMICSTPLIIAEGITLVLVATILIMKFLWK